MTQSNPTDKFPGFEKPQQNWSKMPHDIIAYMSAMAGSELKVVLYVLRHTWGYQEFGIVKRITLDEFQNGRKKSDGTRIDGGTGLSTNSVKEAVKKAVERGFLIRELDGRDPGRQSHAYALNMLYQNDRVSKTDRVSEIDTQRGEGYQKLTPRVSKTDTRSEKDTKKETKEEEKKEKEPQPENSEPKGEELLEQYFGPKPDRDVTLPDPLDAKPGAYLTPSPTNSAVPVSAGGSDAPADTVVLGICQYNGLSGLDAIPAKQVTQMRRKIAEIIDEWGGATEEQARLTWQAWRTRYDWKRDCNPFYSTFASEFGLLLAAVRSGEITRQSLRREEREASNSPGSKREGTYRQSYPEYPTPTLDDQERKRPTVWDTILKALSGQMEKQTFDNLLRGTTADIGTDTLTVICRSEAACEWLHTRLAPIVTQTAGRVLERGVQVSFVCDNGSDKSE